MAWDHRDVPTGRRARALAGVLLAGAVLGGCALPPWDAERITLLTHDAAFVDGLDGAGDRQPGQAVDAYALWPDPALFPPPWPAMVILHTSSGQGSQDWDYGARLQAMGVAALAVDSFGERGVEKTVEDQSLVSEASMMADAYAALGRLAADPRVDPARIGVLGFSKGGIAALYAAFRRFHDALASDGPAPGGQGAGSPASGAGAPAFALHVAYYPWCGVRLLDLRTTGAPILVQTGDLDQVAPPHLCTELFAAVRAADPAARIDFHVLPDARHAFDHPMLDWFSRFPTTAAFPSRCRIEETTPGVFVEHSTGRAVDGDSIAEILEACSAHGALVGGNGEAAAEAWGRTEAAVRTWLQPSVAGGV